MQNENPIGGIHEQRMLIADIAAVKSTCTERGDEYGILAGCVKIRRIENVAEGERRIELGDRDGNVPLDSFDLAETDVLQFWVHIREDRARLRLSIDCRHMSRLRTGLSQADQTIRGHRTAFEYIARRAHQYRDLAGGRRPRVQG